MSILAFDLERYYRQAFGKPPVINGRNNTSKDDQFSDLGNLLKTKYLDKEIWLPVKFFGLKNVGFSFDELLLPYTTIKIIGGKSVIKTPLVERKGSAKELYNTEDYSISVKGFLIDDNRIWPEKQLNYLKGIGESDQSIGLDNALSNIFLQDMGQMVAVLKWDFPEVVGGRKHVRPFSLEMESDNVFSLIIE
jgi:hypothetical protein